MQHSLTTIPANPERIRVQPDYWERGTRYPYKHGWTQDRIALVDREARTLSPWEPDEYEDSFGVCCQCEECAQTKNWYDYLDKKEETRDA